MAYHRLRSARARTPDTQAAIVVNYLICKFLHSGEKDRRGRMKAEGDRWRDRARNANRVAGSERNRAKQELNWGTSTHFIVKPGLEVPPPPFLLLLHQLKYSPAFRAAADVERSAD